MKSHLLLFGLLPAAALAEVSDKAASMEQLLISAVVVAVVAYALIQWHALAGVVATALALAMTSLNYDLLLDPFIGPQLLREQGAIYAWVSYGSAAAVYAAVVTAWLSRYFRRRRAA